MDFEDLICSKAIRLGHPKWRVGRQVNFIGSRKPSSKSSIVKNNARVPRDILTEFTLQPHGSESHPPDDDLNTSSESWDSLNQRLVTAIRSSLPRSKDPDRNDRQLSLV
jgi:hypothetical protein